MEFLRLSTIILFAINVDGFNLDTANVKDVAEDGRKQEGAYFGYSLAFYASPKKTFLYVGAPRFHLGGQCEDTWRQGRVFSCDVTHAYASNKIVCEPLEMDSKCGSETVITSLTSKGKQAWRANKTDMWLGASLDVSPKFNQLIACGHRETVYNQQTAWTNLSENNQLAMTGACFIKSLANGGVQEMRPNAPVTYAMGTSVAFTEDLSRNILAGGPAKTYGRGSIIMNTTAFQELYEQQESLWDESQLGFNVAVGRFSLDIDQGKVFSAPSYNMSGKVRVFASLRNSPYEDLDSEQIGTRFGSYLAACDINGDGMDELLVGAPFWTVKVADEGQVFVYAKDPDSVGTIFSNIGRIRSQFAFELQDKVSLFQGNFQQQVILNGKMPDGRFGSSILCAGDIDEDGFKDVIIGAPYENGGKGSVYIFNGGTSGLRNISSQRISLGEIDTSKHKYGLAFGISLASVKGISYNGYSGVAVGSYLSDSAAILLARPVIRLQAEVSAPAEIQLRNGMCAQQGSSCGNLTIAFRYTGKRVPRNITLSYSILLDTTKQMARLQVPSRSMTGYADMAIDRWWRINTALTLPDQPRDLRAPLTLGVTYKLVDSAEVSEVRAMLEPQDPPSTQTQFKQLCAADRCLFDVETEMEVSFPDNGDKLIYKDAREYNLYIRISNKGDVILHPELVTTLPLGVTFRSHNVSLPPPASCSPGSPQQLSCSLGSMLPTFRSVQVEIVLSVGAVTGTVNFQSELKSAAVLKVQRNATFIQSYPTEVKADVSIYGQFQSHVILLDRKKPEEASTNKAVLTQWINFQVDNLGPGAIPAFLVVVHLQSMYNDTRIMEALFSDNRCALLSEENLMKTCSDWDSRRLKYCGNGTAVLGSRLLPPGPWDADDLEFTKIFCHFDEINAGDGQAGTLNVTIDENAVYEILSYRDTFDVDFKMWAITEDYPNSKQRLTFRMMTQAPPIKHFPWIVVGSAVCGFLLLTLAVFALYKLGFFHRKMQQELKERKRETLRQSQVAEANQDVDETTSVVPDKAEQEVSFEEATGAESKQKPPPACDEVSKTGIEML